MTPRPKRRRRTLASVTPRVFGFVAVAGLAGVVVAGMALPVVGPVSLVTRDSIESFEDLPREFRDPVLPVQTRVFAADGTKIATVYEENRREVTLDQVAPVMRDAVIAIEDSRFYEHNGFDSRGFLRAAVTNVATGEVAQGGSTLTMQYVKNVLVTNADDDESLAAAREDTVTRKLREIRYAMSIEKRLTKDEILERYLNISYYGARAYGVEAASRRYFSKSAKKLELVEAATLAGIVQQPSRFNPTVNPDLAQARRDVVLNRMAELGYITVEEAREAKSLDVEDYLKPKVQYNGCTTSFAVWYCDYAIRKVTDMRALGETPEDRAEAWRLGGYEIHTTLNVKAQRSANKAVKSMIPPRDESKKALTATMIEPGTGNIQAMAQNRVWGTGDPNKRWWETTYNYSVASPDGGGQGAAAGSTFKLFTMLAALEQGISPYTVINSPPTKSFTGFVDCDGRPMVDGGIRPYTVSNSTSSGNFDMFRGAAYSVNTFFVELEKRAGVCETLDVARRLGIRHATGEELGETLPDGATAEVASFTLGSTEVTPLMLANAYATVSAHGIYCEPRVITKIVDRDGKTVPVPAPDCRRAVSRNVADAAAGVLSNVVDGNIPGRTGGAMSIGRDTTGKTGTINDNAAVWFVGSTPDMATAVSLYDPRSAWKNPLTNITINGQYYTQVFGSSIPGPTWKAAMEGALRGRAAVPMDLRNEWNVRPALQAGTPSLNVPPPPAPVTASVPWWQRDYDISTDEGDQEPSTRSDSRGPAPETPTDPGGGNAQATTDPGVVNAQANPGRGRGRGRGQSDPGGGDAQ